MYFCVTFYAKSIKSIRLKFLFLVCYMLAVFTACYKKNILFELVLNESLHRFRANVFIQLGAYKFRGKTTDSES